MFVYVFFFQAEDGIRDLTVTGVQTCALPILVWLLMDRLKYLLMGILLLFPNWSATGATIISTLGPGDSYSACCGFGNVAPTQMAYPFVIVSGPQLYLHWCGIGIITGGRFDECCGY